MKHLSFLISLFLLSASAATAQTTATAEKEMKKTEDRMAFSTGSVSAAQLLADGQESLQAGITCLNAGGGQTTVWSENFDNGMANWTITSEDLDGDEAPFSFELKATSGDKAFSIIDGNDVQSLYISGSYRVYERARVDAVSTAVSIPKNATFSGYVGYSYNLSEDYATLTIYACEDGQETWTPLWSSLDDKEDKSWRWHTVNADMTAYAGKSVRFKLEYGNTANYDNMGYMCDFTIDGLQVNAAAEVTGVDVMTGEIVKFADASTGTPTSWRWSFPGGTPSESTAQYPEVYYTADGTYDVSLTVGDGSVTSTKTLEGFVRVTGVKPTAKIGLPATFRYSGDRLPMVAPYAPVAFTDASEGFPTNWEWTFTGVGDTPSSFVTVTEANPTVRYTQVGQSLPVLLAASNSHGESAAMADVHVGFEGFITNLQPDEGVFTFNLDGYGEFPGTNELGITEYAEKFSKPSRPISVSGVRVYFTNNTATEVIDQIADVKVAICKSENGLPGEELDFMSWRVFELESSGDGSAVGTDFEFTKPVVIDDEFFIVVSGIPEKSETCTVSFATARFRDQGNTAYFKQRGEWKSAASYFPAGQNHTSYAIFPYAQHSIMTMLTDDNKPKDTEEIKVGVSAGETEIRLYSYFGYETPVASDADWCRVTSEPNGLTVDTPKIGYDALPEGMTSRSATLTFTDGMSELEVTLTQDRQSGIAATTTAALAARPSIVGSSFSLTLPEATHTVEIVSAAGQTVFRTAAATPSLTIDASGFAPGIYIVKATATDSVATTKIVKR